MESRRTELLKEFKKAATDGWIMYSTVLVGLTSLVPYVTGNSPEPGDVEAVSYYRILKRSLQIMCSYKQTSPCKSAGAGSYSFGIPHGFSPKSQNGKSNILIDGTEILYICGQGTITCFEQELGDHVPHARVIPCVIVTTNSGDFVHLAISIRDQRLGEPMNFLVNSTYYGLRFPQIEYNFQCELDLK